jgi:tetratricopeptide (TPR) repeat protein
VQYFDELHRDVPNLKASRFTTGWCYQNLGDLGRAVREYEVATTHDPRLVQAHLNLGWARLALKEFGPAILSFDRVLAIEPGNGNARAGRDAAVQARSRKP